MDPIPYLNYSTYLSLVFLVSGSFVVFNEYLTLAIPISVSTFVPMVAPIIMSYNSQMVAVEILLSGLASASGVTISLFARGVFRFLNRKLNLRKTRERFNP